MTMALGLVLRSQSHLYWGSGHGIYWRGEGKEGQKLGLVLMSDSPENKENDEEVRILSCTSEDAKLQRDSHTCRRVSLCTGDQSISIQIHTRYKARYEAMYDNCQMAIIDNNRCALVLPSRDGSLMECFVWLWSQLCFDRTLPHFADDHFCLLPSNYEEMSVLHSRDL